ncbi:CheR family methyltransferase [Telluria beijingensis]|uniref:CheR family methyltransferase n=1 Tax=Telluria beijingensis TaxID=3068633 RepID=UPI00279585A3|nr:CheR family methyltransferase [Massilia sp. REN29]
MDESEFFPNRAVLDILCGKVLPELFQGGQAGTPLRAWVAACAAGEQAYGLAMLLADHADDAGWRRDLQLFASDGDAHAVQAARAGLYPAASVAHLPAARLERHFTPGADGYQVRKTLRERIVFTRHDLLHDPAFSKLDLVACRDVLARLDHGAQRQLLQHFHFALNPGGYLLLGRAESVEAAPDLFAPVDATHRIYQARPRSRWTAPPAAGAARRRHATGDEAAGADRGRPPSHADIHRHASVALGPPAILVDANADILYIDERAARFLRQAGGEPTRALAALVPPPLRLPLRAALFQARRTGEPATTGPLRHAGQGHAAIELQVLPFDDPRAEGRLMLVRFVTAQDVPPVADATPAGYDALVAQLDDELHQLRASLADAVGQAEAADNAMRVQAEEMQSSIEQLRATVAGLEDERDTLHGQNGALGLDRLALQRRIVEADKAHDDLSNLIASSDVATIFLDRTMRILRYTPRIADFFNVLPGDIGRPLPHITNRLDYPQLAEEAARVFDTLQAMEREVRATDGRDYIVRVHPYRTTHDRIEGAVMTFFDISNWRAAEQALRASEERLRLFVSAVSDTLYKMSADWRAKHSLQGKTFLADTDNPSANWLEAYIPESDQARVKEAIAQAIAHKAVFELEHRVIRGDGAIGWTFSRAIPLLDDDGNIVEWFGAATDITARKQASGPV